LRAAESRRRIALKAVRIFICWSGRRSKQIAEALREWLPTVIEGLPAPFLSADIEKGTPWFEAITRALRESQAAIVCLTPEKLASPWIHFEAGAVATGVESARIFTYLFELTAADLRGPLVTFQPTEATESETRMLVLGLAQYFRDLDETVASAARVGLAFDRGWPSFASELAALEPLTAHDVIPGFDALFRRKTFEEPLQDCSEQNWPDRYRGAIETLERLRAHESAFLRLRLLAGAYLLLRSELDGYIMELRSLLESEPFTRRPDGTLEIPPEILVPCEERRERVLELRDGLLTPPSFPESFRFEGADTFAKRKEIVHSLEAELEAGKLAPPRAQLLRARANSRWDLDRIVYYLVSERDEVPDIADLIRCVVRELEHATARGSGTLMPLHYAVGALRAAARSVDGEAASADIERVVERVERFLRDDPKRDRGGQIAGKLEEIRAELRTASVRSRQ